MPRSDKKHKGIAYVEMKSSEDVPNCILLNNSVPDFRNFLYLSKLCQLRRHQFSSTFRQILWIMLIKVIKLSLNHWKLLYLLVVMLPPECRQKC